MIPRLPTLALLALALLPAALPAADPVLDQATIEKTRGRIDALFHRRDAPPVLPRDVPNPFSRPEERHLSAGAAAMDPAKLATLSDQELLQRLAVAIQVRGIVAAAGRPALIINRKIVDEGDTLSLRYGEMPVEVTIKRISGLTYTLGYREAELTLRLAR
jgi:hypothetical protein